MWILNLMLLREGFWDNFFKQNVLFDYVDNSATVSSAGSIKKHRFDLEHNVMFMDIMRDFTILAEDSGCMTLSDMPRMDLVRDSCTLIAQAWEQRKFVGKVEVNFQ